MSIKKIPITSGEINTDRFNVIKNKELIKELGSKYGNVLNRTSLIKMLQELKDISNVYQSLSLNKFVSYLTNHFKYFEEIPITSASGNVNIRYVSTYVSVSPYEIALSVYSKTFLSHYSALYANDLTLNSPKDIYINREQAEKSVDKENTKLTQRKVDYAFTKEMRKTKDVYIFNYGKLTYNVFALSGKNTNQLGIQYMQVPGFSKKVLVTNIERSLIDVTIRPQYSGGTAEVMDAFFQAKKVVNIKKLVTYLEKMDYVYPYERSVLFYLTRAGYNQNQLNQLTQLANENSYQEITFYLDYQMIGKTLDPELNIYYPKELDAFNGD